VVTGERGEEDRRTPRNVPTFCSCRLASSLSRARAFTSLTSPSSSLSSRPLSLPPPICHPQSGRRRRLPPRPAPQVARLPQPPLLGLCAPAWAGIRGGRRVHAALLHQRHHRERHDPPPGLHVSRASARATHVCLSVVCACVCACVCVCAARPTIRFSFLSLFNSQGGDQSP
jgi:hypothetical protein